MMTMMIWFVLVSFLFLLSTHRILYIVWVSNAQAKKRIGFGFTSLLFVTILFYLVLTKSDYFFFFIYAPDAQYTTT